MKKILLTMSLAVGLWMTSGGMVRANEGIVELQSSASDKARCFVLSVLMPDYQYQLVVSCVGLVYPAGPGEYKYALWLNPASGKPAVRVGDLGVGKASFKTREAFYSLYVTKEGPKDKNGKPSQTMLMKADIRRIKFLDGALSGQFSGCPVNCSTEIVSAEPTGIEVKPTGTTIKPKVSPTGKVDVAPVLKTGITVLRVLGTILVAGFVAVLVVVAISSFGGKKKGPPGI